jgi:hypothetical protein
MSQATRDTLTLDAAGMLSQALQAQGPAALACTREHAARHEAGHACAYLAAGRRLRSVEVYRRGEDWLGWTRADGPGLEVTPDTDPAADLAEARILLAGPLAELTTSTRPALGAGLDEIALARSIAANAAAKLGRDPEELLAWLLAATLALLHKRRPTLDTLSAALLRRRKLKGHDLARLLRVNRGSFLGKTPAIFRTAISG